MIFEIHQPWQSGFSRVYSNCCCSCSFEAEIITIGQSSHKIYSNNILNSQESPTILNACTKKSGKLLKAPCMFVNMLVRIYLSLYVCMYVCAFDTVNRSIWKILLKLGCPERFVGLICSLHNGMKARVSFNGTLSEEISINNGVKQGNISAPILFNIYLAIVFLVAFYENSDGIYIRYLTSGSVFNVCKLRSQTKVSSSLVRELLYADDCCYILTFDPAQKCYSKVIHRKEVTHSNGQ